MNSLVSVIVPAYNSAEFIPGLITSLQIQTHTNWECLIVDDGSSDNTEDVVKNFAQRENRIKYIYQKNQGLSAARNTGLKNAKGDYIQFLDADDLIESEKFEKQINFLKDSPDVDIVYGETRFFRSQFPQERRWSLFEPDTKWLPETSFEGEELIIALVKENFIPVNAPLLKKSVISKVRYFDTNLKMYEDWDFWLRCATSGMRMRFIPMENTLALVRMHPASMTNYRKHMQTEQRAHIRKNINKYKVQGRAAKLNKYYQACIKISESVIEIKSGDIFAGAVKFTISSWSSPRAFLDVSRQILNKRISSLKKSST